MDVLGMQAQRLPTSWTGNRRSGKSSISPLSTLRWISSSRRLEAVYPGKADEVEVVDFFGRDKAVAYLCFAYAEMLSMRVPGKYTDAASEKPEYRGGLPIGKLRKVEDYVRERPAEALRIFLSRRWPS